MDQKPDLFERFGGTRAMAALLDEAPSTVQSWKAAGRIPAGKQPLVIATAETAGIEITAEDVIWPLGKPADAGAEAA
jgi:hypothetical protein